MTTEQSFELWGEVLENYARDWDRTFNQHPSYFSQEFWYLLMGCMFNNWRGTPLTVSAATQYMKTGSNRTREERIKKAVIDGYLQKVKLHSDGRGTYVVPTEKLETMMRAHLERTLNQASQSLQKIAQVEARQSCLEE